MYFYPLISPHNKQTKKQRQTKAEQPRSSMTTTTSGRLRLYMMLVGVSIVLHSLFQLQMQFVAMSFGPYSKFFAGFWAPEFHSRQPPAIVLAVPQSDHDALSLMNDFTTMTTNMTTTTKRIKQQRLNDEEWSPSDNWLQLCVQEEQSNKSNVRRAYAAKWPRYQLGDCLKQCKSCSSSIAHSRRGKMSIAGQYWKHVCHEKDLFTNEFNITFLSELFRKYESDPHPYKEPWPKPAEDELVIHLRIGDIIDLPQYSGNVTVLEMLKNGATTRHGANSVYLDGIKSVAEYLATIRESGLTKVVLRGGSHIPYKYPKSRVFTACLAKAIRKAGYDITSLQVDGEANPDQDFYYMAHAKHFVMASGGYSRFIARIVLHSGGRVVGRTMAPVNVSIPGLDTNVAESK